MTRTLHQFHGGVHPPQHKTQSTSKPIGIAPLPSRITVPLQQHIGNRAKPVVKVGDKVLKGQLIGKADGYISVNIHAPTSGEVVSIDMGSVPHPSGLPDLCITIVPDGQDQWIEHHPIDYLNMEPSEVRNRLREAGVVGLGGAVFPTFVKLNPGKVPKVPTLILNGAECEPYITCDDMLMRERARDIVRGAQIMQHLLQAEEVLIGIEDNKPEAVAAMKQACAGTAWEVIPVPTLYPTGGAKQLIQVLTGKEAPSSGRSTDIGVQCFNVGTAYSVQRAIDHGEPVVSRIITVTGNVRRPQNFEALIGTPVNELTAMSGAPKEDTDGYLMGGPMMGFKLPAETVPVVKATNCIIATSPALFPPAPPAMPCIRCTRCADACPAQLQPQELYWFARVKNFGKTQEYNLFDCIECGACSYVCPSHIPLVQYYRFAKSEIWAREKEKNAADLARQRHDFRTFRQERDKQERAEKLAKKTAPVKTEAAGDAAADAKKAAIQAAIERAKAKKTETAAKNVENLSPETMKKIAEIEERRARIKEMASKDNP